MTDVINTCSQSATTQQMKKTCHQLSRHTDRQTHTTLAVPET